MFLSPGVKLFRSHFVLSGLAFKICQAGLEQCSGIRTGCSASKVRSFYVSCRHDALCTVSSASLGAENRHSSCPSINTHGSI